MLAPVGWGSRAACPWLVGRGGAARDTVDGCGGTRGVASRGSGTVGGVVTRVVWQCQRLWSVPAADAARGVALSAAVVVPAGVRRVALSAAVVGARRGAARGTGARPGLTRVVRLTRGGHTSLTNSSTPRQSSMPTAAQVETLRCSRLRRFYGSLQSNSSNMCGATHLRDGHVQATSYSNGTLLSV